MKQKEICKTCINKKAVCYFKNCKLKSSSYVSPDENPETSPRICKDSGKVRETQGEVEQKTCKDSSPMFSPLTIEPIPCNDSIGLGWDCNEGHLCDDCGAIFECCCPNCGFGMSYKRID